MTDYDDYDDWTAGRTAEELSPGETIKLSARGLGPIAGYLGMRGLGLEPAADGAWTVVIYRPDDEL